MEPSAKVRDHTGSWGAAIALVASLVIVPFLVWGSHVDGEIREALAWSLSDVEFGGLVIVFLAADVMIPIPSSVVAVFAGYRLGLVGGALAIWLGLTSGCLIGWLLGKVVGHRSLAWLVGPAEQAWAANWMESTSGGGLVVASRTVPVLSETVAIFAGATGLSLRHFLWLSGLSNIGLALVYSASGALASLSESWAIAFLGSVIPPAIASAWSRSPGKRGD